MDSCSLTEVSILIQLLTLMGLVKLWTYCLFCALVHFCFLTEKTLRPAMTPGWASNCSSYIFPLLALCFDTFSSFRNFFADYGIQSLWLDVDQQGHLGTWTWNDTWMGHTSVKKCCCCISGIRYAQRWPVERKSAKHG